MSTEAQEKAKALWSGGAYEVIAEHIASASEAAVEAVAPKEGTELLDVACGTGNASLIAARRGARVRGVDLSERLISVAAERAGEAGLDADFRIGDATSLPVEDGEFEVVVSVFGVIFADAAAAAPELLRAVRPGGRIAFSAWTPEGPLHRLGELVRESLGAPADAPTWSDEEVLRSLFDGHELHVEEHSLAFTGPSVDEWLADQLDHHPLYLDAKAALEDAGRLDAVRAASRDVLALANEDAPNLRITARYRIVTVVRAA